jgi:hypothetical protein
MGYVGTAVAVHCAVIEVVGCDFEMLHGEEGRMTYFTGSSLIIARFTARTRSQSRYT